MSTGEVRIFPLGDAALTVEFGRTISEDLNQRAIALADHLQRFPFPGFVEAVPAYASTTVFYNPQEVRRVGELPLVFETVRDLVVRELAVAGSTRQVGSRTVEVEVVFDGPDLEDVAAFAEIPTSGVAEIFLGREYRVYMLGFLPGFTYMAEVDERIAMPRKDMPRTVVPKGSVGIAGRQTGIYSLPSPGGWQLIGHTDVEIFSPGREPLTVLQPGDTVKFVAR